MKGLIFDIKEFALNDGSGIRTTVFFKGCPLHCIWCHNPEGMSAKPELYIKKNGCLGCGLCKKGCNHPECAGLGRCLHVCPKNLISVAGEEWESSLLAKKLIRNRSIYEETGGGVTLSGGEPLLQYEFAIELLCALEGINRTIETSGYAAEKIFSDVIERCDFVYMDLKIADRDRHRKYTGVVNDSILKNAEILKKSGKPHTFRIPLIPGITDTADNLKGLSEIAGDSPVELLPYNRLAPAKYPSVGRVFTDLINPENQAEVDISIFRNAKMRK